MLRIPWKPFGVVAGLAGLGAIAAMAGEPTPTFAVKCAERDLQVVKLIEDRGRAGNTASEILADAARAQMRAQATCRQGRVGAALVTYDRIIAKLDPARLGAVQARYPD